MFLSLLRLTNSLSKQPGLEFLNWVFIILPKAEDFWMKINLLCRVRKILPYKCVYITRLFMVWNCYPWAWKNNKIDHSDFSLYKYLLKPRYLKRKKKWDEKCPESNKRPKWYKDWKIVRKIDSHWGSYIQRNIVS